MAPTRLTDRPIQLRHDEEDEIDIESSDRDLGEDDDDSENDVPSNSESKSEHEDTAPSSDGEGNEDDNEEPSLAEISFGALAKAQETFDPKPRKRKFSEAEQEPAQFTEEDTFDTRKRAKEARVSALKRTSKHAPPVESARKPVSRKRVIFEPPTSLKSRDPRFDPTVMSSNRHPSASVSANKNYSFLSQYQAEEILQLKAQIKKAKDPEEVADLKRQVMSMESKIRNAEARQRETEIRKKHKEKEKEAIRSGQKAKPYYLKEADVRKLAKEERLQGLGKKARDKADKRRQKREKGKDSRDMPRVRRER
ncbi:rRNA biogenesis protein rrp36 [Cladophialophora chaetospira]|uniref:rRNA biogenesis protein RRP36 n=1 Tax=Cladophialophora chaetospira TaxID=386627 RepID=A0AA38XFK4_9EURO|nr:rRNA biogenesis protein rrp36 [Cladophialophora chaetospira]